MLLQALYFLRSYSGSTGRREREEKKRIRHRKKNERKDNDQNKPLSVCVWWRVSCLLACPSAFIDTTMIMSSRSFGSVFLFLFVRWDRTMMDGWWWFQVKHNLTLLLLLSVIVLFCSTRQRVFVENSLSIARELSKLTSFYKNIFFPFGFILTSSTITFFSRT